MKMRSATAVPVLLGVAIFSPPAGAQPAVPARAGMIHFAQGRILVDQKPLEIPRNRFPLMDEGDVMETRRGLVEVLLNAGTFLRMAENSSFRLDSGDLTDTRISILKGTLLFEVDDLRDDNSIVLDFGGAQIRLAKNGLYHFTAGKPHSGEPARLRVYDGEAQVAEGIDLFEDDPVKVKKGHEVVFTSALNLNELEDPDKFDRDETDALYRWSVRRARTIAQANASSARRMIRTRTSPGWLFNPYYGGFAFVPQRGYGYSPFGLTVFSPQTMSYVLQPRVRISASPFPGGFGGFGGGGGMILGSGGGGAVGSAPATRSTSATPNSAGARRR